MLARRLGRTARLSRSITSAVNYSYGVASTSYAQPLPFTQTSRSFTLSSLPGPFSPSPTRLKKKTHEASVEAVADEEAFENEEEEDMFAATSEEAEKTEKKIATVVKEKIPFQEVHETLSEKLRRMEPEESVYVDLRNWKQLVESAMTEEDLKQCLNVAMEWKKLTYTLKSKLQRLTVRETTILINQARILHCPELMFDAVMDRKSNGIEYDVDSLRQIQESLVSKLGIKARKVQMDSAARGSSTEEGTEETLKEEITNELTLAEQKKENFSASIKELHELNLAKLSNLDRTLTLAASTCIFSPSKSDVDEVSLIYAISGLIKSFKLLQYKRSEQDDFYKSQIYPRLSNALIALYTTKQGILQGIFPRRNIQKAAFSNICREIRNALVLHESYLTSEGGVNIQEVNSRMEQVEAVVKRNTLHGTSQSTSAANTI